MKTEKQGDWLDGLKPYRFREGSWLSHEASSPGVQCKSEGKLSVGAVVGKSGAAQDRQSKRMVLVMGKGKRAGKAAVTFVLLMN